MTAVLDRPAGAHLVTYWGDRFGRHHRRCSCGQGTPAPGMASGVAYDGPTGPQVADTLVRACVDYSALAALLERAGRLIAARPIHGAAHATRLACERRSRGLAYLALIVAAAEPSPEVLDDASPTAAPDASGHGTTPGPVAGRGEPGDSGPSPACHPEQSDAHLAPGAEPDATPAPEPIPPATPDPLPDGYVRLSWVCGHSAGGPARHGWADHRHPCPECNLHPLDRRCPGVQWAAPRRVPLAAVHVRRCALCGTEPARPYPDGSRCDGCSPWAVAGRPDPRLARLPVADRLPPDLRAVSA